MMVAAREDRIYRADEVAQVVGGGNQAGAGQVDLPFTEQMGHLWGEGEAANPHRHHQGDKAGE
ncbi:hypothetical protein H096_18503 [Pseudomonas sp. FH1]|nr:hypothetical protein H096_18503 [Pseudomonas sp. FH1]